MSLSEAKRWPQNLLLLMSVVHNVRARRHFNWHDDDDSNKIDQRNVRTSFVARGGYFTVETLV